MMLRVRRTARALAFATAAVALCVSWPAIAAPGAQDLGGYEKQALEQALALRKLVVDDAPDGKVVGKIHVTTLNPLTKAQGFLQRLNALHVNSREGVIEREVLLRPGRVWDWELVAETRRNLIDPLISGVVVLVPVLAKTAGHVDLLVVVRDLWSLRNNTIFEFQAGLLTRLTFELSENNLAGYRKRLAAVFKMDLGTYSFGPLYVDPRLAGTRLTLMHSSDVVFSREDYHAEGSRSQTLLSYPFWALDRTWSASMEVSHTDAPVRVFNANGLLTYDAPDTPLINDHFPREYGRKTFDIRSEFTQSYGREFKHRFGVGYRLGVTRSSVLDTFVGGPIGTAAFERDVLPMNEVQSALFARYRIFTPRYVVHHNVSSFDFPEDRKIGPDASVELSTGLKVLGSDFNFFQLSVQGGWIFDLKSDGFLSLSGGLGGRIVTEEILVHNESVSGGIIDSEVRGEAIVATPSVAKVFRVAARLAASRFFFDTKNRLPILGGQTGLRGYPIGAFSGPARLVANVELRSMPIRFGFTRLGGVLFWDMGHAADSFGKMSIHHDLGVGVRFILPWSDITTWRLDWAVPTNSADNVRPGVRYSRITFGFLQLF